MQIPVVDLKIQYQNHKEEIDQAMAQVISETAFISGKYAHQFATHFAKETKVAHCIPVANGTDALYIAMKVLGIGEGDEVITTASSWISTSETIAQTGATPVFVDIDTYHLIDVTAIEAKITSRTKAIIPVHLFGQMADMHALQAICKKHNLKLIEDCAQAHFATQNGQYAGTFGDISTFSFFPSKNLGAFGDAGGIVTNDETLAERCYMFANHGAKVRHEHKIDGVNSRMDGIQAAILNVKLKYIHEWTALRQEVAAYYKRELSEIAELELPKVKEGNTHVYHVYSMQTQRRNELKEYLFSKGIQTAIHYPTPLPFMECYAYQNNQEVDFEQVSKVKDAIIALPMYPELSLTQLKYITDQVKSFFKK